MCNLADSVSCRKASFVSSRDWMFSAWHLSSCPFHKLNYQVCVYSLHLCHQHSHVSSVRDTRCCLKRLENDTWWSLGLPSFSKVSDPGSVSLSPFSNLIQRVRVDSMLKYTVPASTHERNPCSEEKMSQVAQVQPKTCVGEFSRGRNLVIRVDIHEGIIIINLQLSRDNTLLSFLTPFGSVRAIR